MNFASTNRGFQAKINAIAAVAGRTGEQVYELWRKYDRQCSLYDQSPVMSEFIQWYANELGGDASALWYAVDAVEFPA